MYESIKSLYDFYFQISISIIFENSDLNLFFKFAIQNCWTKYVFIHGCPIFYILWFVAVYCFISAFLFLCMSLIPPLLDIVLPLNESRPILSVHPGYYFVDEKEYFFYIFWHAVVVWEIAVTGIVAHDCMLLTYIEHVCSIFALGG